MSLPPNEFARVLSLPAGAPRNAGLNELAGRYNGRLESFARHELQAIRWDGHLEAQDVVQSLYVKLMTVEPQEQICDEQHLVNWLRFVLRNHVREQAKAMKAKKRDVSRLKRLPGGDAPEPSEPLAEDRRPGVSPRGAPPTSEAERNEDLRRYRDLLARAEASLSGEDWDLFRRHHLEGEAQSDIASRLRRTPGAVCQRLKRICRTLRGRFPAFADVLSE